MGGERNKRLVTNRDGISDIQFTVARCSRKLISQRTTLSPAIGLWPPHDLDPTGRRRRRCKGSIVLLPIPHHEREERKGGREEGRKEGGKEGRQSIRMETIIGNQGSESHNCNFVPNS